jgi:hypothetical protein
METKPLKTYGALSNLIVAMVLIVPNLIFLFFPLALWIQLVLLFYYFLIIYGLVANISKNKK